MAVERGLHIVEEHGTPRTIYRCDGCGAADVWRPGWSWYGSYRDLDDGRNVPTYCPQCTAKQPQGGHR